MRFEKTFPDRLQSQIKLSDLISKRISIKNTAADKFIALCPFHKEKTPSFHIDDRKEFYHCFGCGAHGNIFNFVMETENLPFGEAVTKIADDYNIPIPYVKNAIQDKSKLEKIDKSYQIHQIISNFFENNIYSQDGDLALKYLKSRSLDSKIIKKFRLGFADKNPNKLLAHLKDHNFSQEEIIASGVFSKSDRGEIYCRFKNRVIFPITNNKNQIIAYGGRVLDNSLPKYLNSPETELFQKRFNLYNLANAKKEIYQEKYAILVEGYMDVISLDNYQISNVVAPLGTAITKEQLQILFRITNNIIICLDGDEAGIRGAKRIINLALPIINANNHIKFVFLPDKTDPDDFVKNNGKKEMLNFLKNSKDFSEILFQFEVKDLDIDISNSNITPEKKTILQSNIQKKTDLITDNITKRNFLQYYNNLLFFLGKKNKNTQNNHSVRLKKIDFVTNFDADIILSCNILNILIHFPDLINYGDADVKILDLTFSNNILENIREEIFEKMLDDKFEIVDLKEFVNVNFSDYDQLSLIEQKIFANNIIKDPEIAIIKVKILYLKLFLAKIEQEYKEYNDKILQLSEEEFIAGKKEMFDYKTNLEKKILDLEKRFNI